MPFLVDGAGLLNALMPLPPILTWDSFPPPYLGGVFIPFEAPGRSVARCGGS